MKLFFEKVHLYLISLNKVKLIALFILLNILNSFSFSMLAYFFTGVGLTNHSIRTMGAMDELLIAVVFAPILETVIFQYALIESIRQKIKPLYACFLSATAFALVHCYSVFYFLFAFISGLIFAYLYYLEKSILKSFLLVLSAHFLYNMLIYITKFL